MNKQLHPSIVLSSMTPQERPDTNRQISTTNPKSQIPDLEKPQRSKESFENRSERNEISNKQIPNNKLKYYYC